MIERYLDDLERRIDPQIEDQLYAEWKAFTDGKWRGDVFSPRRIKASPASLEWPRVMINDAIEDNDMMILEQMAGCSAQLANASGLLLAVRANYGTSILPSLFGVNLFVMDRDMNTLPTSYPLEGGRDAVRRLVAAGVPTLRQGLAGKALAMAERFAELAETYPKIGEHVRQYHPDLQGPMDICEVLWGSSLFLELVDEPDLVKDFLSLITDTYVAFMKEWLSIVPSAGNGHAIHWGWMHRGSILLRDDSAMNLSPDMFDEFIRPYDQKLLSTFGGGCIHFCGRGDHYIDRLATMEDVHGVHTSQPECNDMEKMFQHTVDLGTPLYGLQKGVVKEALDAERELHGKVHCGEWHNHAAA